ncbi:DinB family protein [Bacillus cereus group sp. BfR-BA-01331]|uniref:DinB family protein n=1 Tax=Bacillus cereus group sp. BfR-BA-01331 TaxID=2920307 RepID=UPI001F569634|nr:DinB family protein [Bacillus cereus group sp. BfR-BA-01331]
MNSTTTLEKFESLATYYLEELEKYSLEQFRTKPSAEEWSLGQMYNHLLSATYMQLDAIEKCKTETPSVANKKTDMGEKVYIMGAFPDIQIKVPDYPGYTPENRTTKEEVQEHFLELITIVKDIKPTLTSIPNDCKVEHPGLGYLNATEWFQLISMHFAHHLRQKERLEIKVLV